MIISVEFYKYQPEPTWINKKNLDPIKFQVGLE
jgi:hypothetical protein